MPVNIWNSLKEIASIVERAAPNRSQVLNRNASPKLDYVQLYKLLLDPSITSEAEAARKLGRSISDPSYKMLRTSLKKILLNTLFVLDYDETEISKYAAASHQSNKDVFLLQTLVASGARHAARSMAPGMLATAHSYQLFSNEMAIIAFMRRDAAMIGDERTQRRLSLAYERAASSLLIEQRAASFLEEILSAFAASGSEKPGLKKKAEDYSKEVEKSASRLKTFHLRLHAYRLRAVSHQVGLDFEAALRVATAAQKFAESQTLFKSPLLIAEFAAKRIVCLLHLGRIDEGLTLIKGLLPKLRETTSNWLLLMDFKFLFEMQGLRFAEAKETYNRVQESDAFSTQPPFQNQKWDVYGLYLNYALGSLTKSENLQDLLEYIPAYAKDKAGYNVAVIILHIMRLIVDEEYEQVTARVDALRMYAKRNLNDRGAERESLFLKLLMVMEGCSFDRAKIEKRAAKYLERLNNLPGSNASGPQILPYPYLWNRIIESLK